MLASLLGTTKTIESPDLPSFSGTLRQYITAESFLTTGRQRDGAQLNKAHSTDALWPLIKMARIYCNAPALSSGAILVDLPGSADTNKARSGVAAKYMKDCSHVWVVTNIKRATADQNAKGV